MIVARKKSAGTLILLAVIEFALVGLVLRALLALVLRVFLVFVEIVLIFCFSIIFLCHFYHPFFCSTRSMRPHLGNMRKGNKKRCKNTR